MEQALAILILVAWVFLTFRLYREEADGSAFTAIWAACCAALLVGALIVIGGTVVVLLHIAVTGGPPQ